MKYRLTPLQIQKQQSIEQLLSAPSLPLTGTAKTKYSLPPKLLADLEADIEGEIVFPWSPGYDTDKKDFNNVYPAEPLLIVYVANYADVRECLEFAKETNVPFVIRSGGHSLACYSVCDGMIIDISRLKSVYVNTQNNTAEVEAGNTFGDLNPKFEFYGLHMPGGGCPTVSVAGFMQGGGYGLTSRSFGMNCDCVLEVTVMTADGNLVVANANQNQDLFWAVRGGTGGNFGVLLRIKYQLFPLGLIWGIRITWNFDDNLGNGALALYTIQENYLKGYQLPNMGIETVICKQLDKDRNPGPRMIYFGASFIGSETDLDNAVAPLLAIPGANVEFKKQGKYSDVNSWVLDGIPDVPMDIKAFSRSMYIGRELAVADYANILKFFKTAPNKYTMVDMEGYGGKINTIEEGACAFNHRHALMDFFCDAFFDEATNDRKENEIWLNEFFEFMRQFGNGRSYQNYPNRDQEDFRWAYFGPAYNQLVMIKQKYDPANLFNYPQSIGPDIIIDPEKQQLNLFSPSAIHHEVF